MTITNWHTAHKDSLTPGQRAADALRNGMGSWWFIAMFVTIMVLWAITNSIVLSNGSFDPYPYILLNLFLSMLAGLQGAILVRKGAPPPCGRPGPPAPPWGDRRR